MKPGVQPGCRHDSPVLRERGSRSRIRKLRPLAPLMGRSDNIPRVRSARVVHMGTWGTGVFADDDAVDVRSDFEHYAADSRCSVLSLPSWSRRLSRKADLKPKMLRSGTKWLCCAGSYMGASGSQSYVLYPADKVRVPVGVLSPMVGINCSRRKEAFRSRP